MTFLFRTHDPRIIGAVAAILRIEDGAMRSIPRRRRRMLGGAWLPRAT